MNKPQTIRWLIAHEPVALFLRTAEAFSSKLDEITGGKFKVEVFTPTQYLDKIGCTGSSVVFSRDSDGPMIEMDKGEIEMSQLHITEIARFHNPDFFALEMPFLFRDHDHAATVFEGPIGKGLLNSLVDSSPAKGLAFTYSGGFRCIATEGQVNSLSELQGKKFATGMNPVTVDTVNAIGAVADPFPIADHARKFVQEGYQTEAVETTIPRYLAQFKDSTKRNLLNTKHSLFLTTIIISNKFWASLDTNTQDAFQEASLHASRLERKWSVDDAENFAAQEDHSDIGVTYSELSDVETTKFKELTAPLYNKYKDYFYPGLIDGIIKS